MKSRGRTDTFAILCVHKLLSAIFLRNSGTIIVITVILLSTFTVIIVIHVTIIAMIIAVIIKINMNISMSQF